MVEQQRDYARALLTHVNAYASAAYAAESAVALVEINNENGPTMEWNGGSLDNMPNPYAAEFRRQWNKWLARKYGRDEKLASAWNQSTGALGGEMLKSERASWNLEQQGGAKAEYNLTSGAGKEALHIHLVQPGRESWHVQFNQPGMKFERCKSYTVTFRAKADQPRKASINLGQAHEPWKVLANDQVQLTMKWEQFRLTVSLNEGDDEARLNFSSLGSTTGDYFFGDISLRPGGVLALRDGEKIGAVDFFKRNDIGSRTPAAQRDWNHFLFDTEAHYWSEMSRFIKAKLHARSLVLGSATGFSLWPVQAMLDAVDAHSYWQHPHFPHRQWDMNNWVVRNESMAGAPDGGALPALAVRRVAGQAI